MNLALLDAAELARGIVASLRRDKQSGGDHNDDDQSRDDHGLDEAVRAYEQRMTARSSALAMSANDAIVEHYAPGGPDVDSIPDFDEAGHEWQANARAYREERTSEEPSA